MLPDPILPDPMQSAFDDAALAIFANDTAGLETFLASNPGLAQHQAQQGHPTLLQLVACEEVHLADPAHITRLLIGAGAPTAAPLVAAAGCNGVFTLQAILDHGTNVDAEDEWTPLDEALYWNQRDIVTILVRHGASKGRLRRAAGVGDVAEILSFFEGPTLRPEAGPLAGPFADTYDTANENDPQAIIDHAFVMAANSGQQEAAAELLRLGARINAVPPGYHWRGTALHAAIWRGDGDLVRWLLVSGADPSLRDGLADADALGWAKHHARHSGEDLVSLFVDD